MYLHFYLCLCICRKYSSDKVKQYWERRHLHIERDDPSYYKLLLSTSILDTVLRNNEVFFTKNIDITYYVDGERVTYNPPGRALPHVVWDFYRNGCSVRMLNPQTFIHEIYVLCSKNVDQLYFLHKSVLIALSLICIVT